MSDDLPHSDFQDQSVIGPRVPTSLSRKAGASTAPRQTPQLFELPEYDLAQFQFMHKGVRALMEAKDPLFASIKKVDHSESIAATQNTMDSGEVVVNPPIEWETEFVLTYEEIAACDVGALAQQMDEAADKSLKTMMTAMFETILRTSKAAGTTRDAGGKPFSHELLLEAFENLELSFDERGEPVMPTLVIHPDMLKTLSALPPRTAQQEDAFQKLIGRKREEHHARKRHRKLH